MIETFNDSDSDIGYDDTCLFERRRKRISTVNGKHE